MSHAKGTRVRRALGRSCVVGIAVVAACAGGGGGGGGGGGTDGGGGSVPSDVKAPFESYGTSTTFRYAGAYPSATAPTFWAGFTGQKVISGTSFQVAKVGRDVSSADELASPSTKGLEIYTNVTPTTLVFGGVSDSEVASVTMTPPVTVDLAAPVGQKRTYDASATVSFGAGGTPGPVTGKLEMTLAESGAAVTTSSGTYQDTRHYTGALVVTGAGLPSGLGGASIAADVWVHPVLGVIGAKIPLLGIDLGFEGEADYGPASSGMNACRRVAVLTDANPSFSLSTYDRARVFDADKNTHAKMLLELRFARDADAQTKTASDLAAVQIQFGTVMGSYDHTLVESPVSVFHPEEAGKGYKYWYALVDQAAKNEPGSDGIAYRIEVNKPSGVAPVRATARILYKLVP